MQNETNMHLFFTTNESQLYSKVLDFLENVYSQRGKYTKGKPTRESVMDVLVLNFTKVVNDCRAILLLTQSGFYMQAGILARSTADACNLMMHICFDGDDAELAKSWRTGKQVKHWKIVKMLNESLRQQLDIDNYEKTRKRLDDFVHANYNALKLYPAQSPGSTSMEYDSFRGLTFWKPLVYLYLVSCLLAVQIIVPPLKNDAESHLAHVQQMYSET